MKSIVHIRNSECKKNNDIEKETWRNGEEYLPNLSTIVITRQEISQQKPEIW